VCIIAPVTPAAKKLAVSTPFTASKNKKKDSSSDSDSSDDDKKKTKPAIPATKSVPTPTTKKAASSSSSSDSDDNIPTNKKPIQQVSPVKSTIHRIFTVSTEIYVFLIFSSYYTCQFVNQETCRSIKQ
jgi:hypothetical protein